MQRLTARLMLLFALVGTFAPLALALTTAPAHACCIRKSPHQCHSAPGAETDQVAAHSTSCCNQDCRRAVTTSGWANPQSVQTAVFARNISSHVTESHPSFLATHLRSSRSPRAPPYFSIA